MAVSVRRAERRGLKQAQSNPPFDKRITALAPAGGRAVNLKRGKLVAEETDLSGIGWTVKFLYNPSVVSISHSVAADTVPTTLEDRFDKTLFQGDTLSSLSWSLLFDRTYETWDSSYADKPAGKYGVYADVRALYGMTQMVGTRSITGFDLITSPMVVTPATVYFGGESNQDGLSFYGQIAGMNVTYTHWTTKMIPNRCVVEMSMKIFPKEPYATSGGGGGNKPTGGKRAPSGGRSSGRATGPGAVRTIPPGKFGSIGFN